MGPLSLTKAGQKESLSQDPWRKDAGGQIGFLTEWGISCWGGGGGAAILSGATGSLWGCCWECHWYVPGRPESLRFRGGFSLAGGGGTRSSSCRGAWLFSRGHVLNIVSFFVLLWVTKRTLLIELTLSALQASPVLFNQRGSIYPTVAEEFSFKTVNDFSQYFAFAEATRQETQYNQPKSKLQLFSSILRISNNPVTVL